MEKKIENEMETEITGLMGGRVVGSRYNVTS